MNERCIRFIVVLLAAASGAITHDAKADMPEWRVVETTQRLVTFAPPGLTEQEPRITSRVNDMVSGRSEDVCWGDPQHQSASACITFDMLTRVGRRFGYVKPTSVAAMVKSLKSVDKVIEREIREYPSAASPLQVVRFRVQGADSAKNCFSLSRYWKGNRRRLTGWYCAPSGHGLPDDLIVRIVSSIAIQS